MIVAVTDEVIVVVTVANCVPDTVEMAEGVPEPVMVCVFEGVVV